MMASFQPHPGGMQPGMHPGMPGMPPGGGQPMGHMQMGNVSGAGGPHMAQAVAMMGMQPGVGGMPGGMPGQGPGMGMPGQSIGGPAPSAMAISHLTPQAGLMQQQQHQLQQQMQNNPQMAFQQQQAMVRQRQIMAAQQHQMGGMGMGANPAQMGLNPQQMAQLQNNPAFQGPAGMHNQQQQLMQMQQLAALRQQQAQQHAQAQAQALQQQQQAQQHQQAQQQAGQPQQPQQQAQQAQQQQAQQQQAQQQSQQQQQQAQQQAQQQQQQGPQQQGPGPNQQQNMAHHVAMQHAASQQSNHSAPGPPQQGQQQQQQQQQHQGQMRSVSQAPTGADSVASASTPQQSQSTQQNQQPGQQGPQPTQPGQGMTQAQQMQIIRQRQLMAHQQQAQQQAAAQAQMAQSRGSFILKLLSFCDHLSSFDTKKRDNDIGYWQGFVNRFFGPDGRLILYMALSSESRTKQWVVPQVTLARYWWTYFQSGVYNLQVKMENPKESVLQNNCHHVAFERTQFVFWYSNGVQVVWHGKLNAMFPPGSDKLEVLEFELGDYQEFVPKTEIARVVSSMGSPTMTRSPKVTKNQGKQRQMSKIKGLDSLITMDDFVSAPIKDTGVPHNIVQFLEIGETFYMMRELIDHAAKSELRPTDAVTSINQVFEEQASNNPQQNDGQNNNPQQGGQANQPTPQQIQMMQQQRQASTGGMTGPQAMGNRTPMQAHMQLQNQNNPNANFSPQVAHLNMPMGMSHLNGPMNMTGSPHVPHPGLPHNPNLNMLQQQQSQNQAMGSPAMGAPGMLPQHSAQGTNSSAGASANTSPNVSAKRRRSQIKMEDEPGGDANGRVKASPRVGGNKKMKG